jgi:hypothetical protein
LGLQNPGPKQEKPRGNSIGCGEQQPQPIPTIGNTFEFQAVGENLQALSIPICIGDGHWLPVIGIII